MDDLLGNIVQYFETNLNSYLIALREHILISLAAFAIAVCIGVPLGIVCARYKSQQKWLVGVFQVLRIIPSLAILVLLIPVLGTGATPAVVALVILAVPPILMNTVAGLEEVPFFMVETSGGMGMTERQIWRKVRLPLALPMILAGAKTALIEIIASATLAAKIGAGGLGGLIFTGLSLNRVDLIVIGGVSVALLSILSGVCLGIVDRILLRYKYLGTKGSRLKEIFQSRVLSRFGRKSRNAG